MSITEDINLDMCKRAAEMAGLDPQSYSGRGMMGETCFAVAFEWDYELDEFLREIALELAEEGGDDEEELLDLVNELRRSMRQDQLGRRGIAYWPSIAYPWSPDEDE